MASISLLMISPILQRPCTNTGQNINCNKWERHASDDSFGDESASQAHPSTNKLQSQQSLLHSFDEATTATRSFSTP